jgi:hypothetical protein
MTKQQHKGDENVHTIYMVFAHLKGTTYLSLLVFGISKSSLPLK